MVAGVSRCLGSRELLVTAVSNRFVTGSTVPESRAFRLFGDVRLQSESVEKLTMYCIIIKHVCIFTIVGYIYVNLRL